MQIEKIDQCAVTVSLSPGDALLFADACRRAALCCTTPADLPAKQTYNLAASHLEGLALIAAAQGLVAGNVAFLEQWTLPHVRQDWAVVGTEQQEASK
jgi:hypothetical protein